MGDIKENAMANGEPVKIRALDVNGNSILADINDVRNIRFYSVAKGEERYLDFNYSGIISLGSNYTGFSCIFVTVTSSDKMYIISNPSIHYTVGEDVSEKICFYKKNGGGRFYIKNNLSVDTIVEIHLL